VVRRENFGAMQASFEIAATLSSSPGQNVRRERKKEKRVEC